MVSDSTLASKTKRVVEVLDSLPEINCRVSPKVLPQVTACEVVKRQRKKEFERDIDGQIRALEQLYKRNYAAINRFASPAKAIASPSRIQQIKRRSNKWMPISVQLTNISPITASPAAKKQHLGDQVTEKLQTECQLECSCQEEYTESSF